MVLVRDIPIYSLCEHHMVPFIGHAHVAYIPGKDGRITGLSKIARLVDGFSRRLQVQEKLTVQIADAMEATLEPRGVIVVVDAEHLCMSMRGIKKSGSSTVTSAVRGLFRQNIATRDEAMRFLVTARLTPKGAEPPGEGLNTPRGVVVHFGRWHSSWAS